MSEHQASRAAHQGTESTPSHRIFPPGTDHLLDDVIAVPRDRDAKALVEAILEEAQADRNALVATWGLSVTVTVLLSKLGLIRDNAERLAVLLAERDAEREDMVKALKEIELGTTDHWAEKWATAALARVKGDS